MCQKCPDNSFFLSDVSEKDKTWDERRFESEIVTALYEGTEFHSYSQRMSNCSQFLMFAWAASTEGDLSLKLHQARFCRVRSCPVCQWRRSLMWRARFYNAVPRLLHDYPKHRFVFLTLTVRNCAIDNLGDSIQLLNSAFKKLTKRKQFPAIGWLKSVEVTRNEQDDSAHPHLHVLLMVPDSYFQGAYYLSQPKWRELWKECLGVDYLPVVNVKAVKAKGADQSEALKGALTETLKYTVKPSDLIANQDWLVELTRQLHKRRMIGVGGVLRSYISEDEPIDLIHAEGVEELSKAESEIWFAWRREVYRYRSFNHG
jgi:plasmid rolling circle replication initiator protein Rep